MGKVTNKVIAEAKYNQNIARLLIRISEYGNVLANKNRKKCITTANNKLTLMRNKLYVISKGEIDR